MIRITENLSHSDDNFFCSAKNNYGQLQKILGQTSINLGKPRENYRKKLTQSDDNYFSFGIKYLRTAIKYSLGTLQKISKTPEKKYEKRL